jgi:hypothetical protein
MNTRTAIFCASVGLFFNSAKSDTFTVTKVDDTGAGTLRQAITDANAHANSLNPGNASDRIEFNIPGGGVHTIQPAAALPTITEAVTIDGYTQPGSSPNTNPTTMGLNTVLTIELSPTVFAGNGLDIAASNCTVRGLVINSFQSRSGIHIAGPSSQNNVIEGNFIGTDPTGTVARPNGGGGVFLENGPSNNTIGGTTPAARNLISGNSFIGVTVQGDTNIVQGNLIGTDVTGTLALGNSSRGINVQSGTGTLIGGTTVAARNIISGNSNASGIDTFASGSALTVQGNFIGTDVTGTIALPNSDDGVAVNTNNNVIGGLTATPGTPPGNLISASGTRSGVLVAGGSSNLIQGNIIGADITGTQPLGNHQRGINIVDNGGTPSHDNTIGGSDAHARNIIAFNGTACDGFGTGVSIGVNPGNISNAILGNSIFSNASLGIDLEAPGDTGCGVTPNDPGDADTGPNNLQNYPVITSVTNSGGSTSIVGTLNSTANTMFRVEFFANNATDPTGFGEGQSFLGFANVPTDNNGNASFNVTFPQVAGEPHITATATDPNGNTSEFSAAIGQLLNISTRMRVLTGDNVLIGGFIITGTDDKHVIVRGIGPSLTSQGVPGALQDPTLELHDSTGALLAFNDNWKDTQQVDIEATGIPPTNDLESAIVATLPANGSGYTAILRGKNDTTGVGLVEAYDLNRMVNSKLANISTRGFVDTGDNVMIGGFIAGNGLTKVIVRAIGPSLTSQGVPGALQDPTLELHDGSGATIASNDNWKDTQQAAIEATTIPPTDDRESAIVTTLAPGPYTAIVRGKNNTTGVALVEVYNIQ